MPRQARIDAPGAVHHVMVRGIERRKIFSDKSILCQEDPYLRERVRDLHLNPYPRTVMARSILLYWAHRELASARWICPSG